MLKRLSEEYEGEEEKWAKMKRVGWDDERGGVKTQPEIVGNID